MGIDIREFGSIKEVPKELIFQRSRDGKTVVLNDGTRVSDELIAKARAAPAKPREAAAAPAVAAGLVSQVTSHPDFLSAVEEAVARAIEKGKGK